MTEKYVDLSSKPHKIEKSPPLTACGHIYNTFACAAISRIRRADLANCRQSPFVAEKLGLFEDGLGGDFLLVRWIAVLAEDPLDQDAQLGADVFADRPVDRDVLANVFHEFAGD